MPNPNAANAGGSAERRMAKYKEERRRQLASQIANRLSAAGSSSSSDEDVEAEKQHESYSRYRRRKKKEGTPGAAGSDRSSSRSGSLQRKSGRRKEHRESPEHIYQQIGGSELSLVSRAENHPPPPPLPPFHPNEDQQPQQIPPIPTPRRPRTSVKDREANSIRPSASFSGEELLMKTATELLDIEGKKFL